MIRNGFDIDGVIYMGKEFTGVYPGPNDVIITGRSFEEGHETMKMLDERGIRNPVFFNPLPYDKKTRESSGEHKVRVLHSIQFDMDNIDHRIGIFFEDDPIQAEIIKRGCPHIHVVLLQHNLVPKHNVRHI